MVIRLTPDQLADIETGALDESGGSIWRDPHVQEQLLAAHLDPDTPAATRSHEAVSRTIELVTRDLPTGAAILDLG